MNNIIDDKLLYLYMPQAESIMLNKIPSECELEHSFSKSFTRKMKALFKHERRSPAMRSFVRQTKTAAAIFAIVIITAFATLMSVEATRERIIEFVVEIKEQLTTINITGNGAIYDDKITPVEPSYIPDGYSISERHSDDDSNYINYADNNGEIIFYRQDLAVGNTQLGFDTQNAKVETKTFNNQEFTVIEKNGTIQIFWYDEDCVYTFLGYIEKEEMILMAESIIEKE